MLYCCPPNTTVVSCNYHCRLWKNPRDFDRLWIRPALIFGPSFMSCLEWFIHLLLCFTKKTHNASTRPLWKLNNSKIVKPVYSDHCCALLEVSVLPYMCRTVTSCMVLLSNKQNLGEYHTLEIFAHLCELRGLCAVTITWNITLFSKYTAYLSIKPSYQTMQETVSKIQMFFSLLNDH